MKSVKLLVSHLFEDVHRPAGTVVEVPNDRAAIMVKCGAAEPTDVPDSPDPAPLSAGEPPDPDAGLDFDAMNRGPAPDAPAPADAPKSRAARRAAARSGAPDEG